MSYKNNLFAVIMAGGKGVRFWPASRSDHPKQLLKIIGNKPLIQQAVERLLPIMPPQNIIIITNKNYVDKISQILPYIPLENIIGEPVGKDTAPCLVLAAAVIAARSDENSKPVMAVLPADHIIKNEKSFKNVILDSSLAAENGYIVTIGITPDSPSTGYGYIQIGENVELKNENETIFYKSYGFKEKPDKKTAEKFLNDGNYKWNSGMFIWSLETLINAFKTHTPDLAVGITILKDAFLKDNFNQAMNEFYSSCQKISIDYAVMEKAKNIIVAESTFDWDDVGSWPALKNHIKPDKNNNFTLGETLQLDSSNCIISTSKDHLIATVDVENLIIVHTKDATLICNSNSAQKIKDLVELLNEDENKKGYI
jgi:mannose-1-phosphate guanylyltransferase